MNKGYERKALNEKAARFVENYKNLDADKRQIVRYLLNRKQKHRLHIVAPSPWPLFSSGSALVFVLGFVIWMHAHDSLVLCIGIACIIFSFIFWFQDIIREGVYMGYHTRIVENCLRSGFVLFLVSEVMFFFGFFWALLHFSIVVEPILGNIWPPEGIVHHLFSENILGEGNRFSKELDFWFDSFNPHAYWGGMVINDTYEALRYYLPLGKILPDRIITSESLYHINMHFDSRVWDDTVLLTKKPSSFKDSYLLDSYYLNNKGFWVEPFASPEFHITVRSSGVLINPYLLPLLNTLILVTSGAVLTLSHYNIKRESFLKAFIYINATIFLGLCFFLVQLFEYINSGYSMHDGVYGSIFYMLTGFHGFHVIIGTVFLIVVSARIWLSHFTANNHFAFEAAAWYWHFVDVVWILLYLLLYLWPSHNYFSGSSYVAYCNDELQQLSYYLDVQVKDLHSFYLNFTSNTLPQYYSSVLMNSYNSKVIGSFLIYKPFLLEWIPRLQYKFDSGIVANKLPKEALKLRLVYDILEKFDMSEVFLFHLDTYFGSVNPPSIIKNKFEMLCGMNVFNFVFDPLSSILGYSAGHQFAMTSGPKYKPFREDFEAIVTYFANGLKMDKQQFSNYYFPLKELLSTIVVLDPDLDKYSALLNRNILVSKYVDEEVDEFLDNYKKFAESLYRQNPLIKFNVREDQPLFVSLPTLVRYVSAQNDLISQSPYHFTPATRAVAHFTRDFFEELCESCSTTTTPNGTVEISGSHGTAIVSLVPDENGDVHLFTPEVIKKVTGHSLPTKPVVASSEIKENFKCPAPVLTAIKEAVMSRDETDNSPVTPQVAKAIMGSMSEPATPPITTK